MSGYHEKKVHDERRPYGVPDPIRVQNSIYVLLCDFFSVSTDHTRRVSNCNC